MDTQLSDAQKPVYSQWRTTRPAFLAKALPPDFVTVLQADEKLKKQWDKVPAAWVCKVCKRTKRDTVQPDEKGYPVFQAVSTNSKNWTGIECICHQCGTIAQSLIAEVSANMEHQGISKVVSLWDFFDARDLASLIYSIGMHRPHQVNFSEAGKLVRGIEQKVRQSLVAGSLDNPAAVDVDSLPVAPAPLAALMSGMAVDDVCAKFDLQPAYLVSILIRSATTGMQEINYNRSGRSWLAPEQDKLLALFDQGKTIMYLAMAFARTPSAIASKLCSLGKTQEVVADLKKEVQKNKTPASRAKSRS